MGTRLDIVVTCTNRKSVAPRAPLRVRDLPVGARGVPLFGAWVERLDAHGGPVVRAADLYQGESWTVSLDLAERAQAVRCGSVNLWVLSAGYGLVSVDVELGAYSATFSVDSPDFVGGPLRGCDGTEACRSWWYGLCTALRRPYGPDSLEALAESTSGDVLLVLSSAYLRACHRDVVRAVSKNKRLIVLAPAAHRSRTIRHAAPLFDARLLTTAQDRQQGVQRPIREGTRMSLSGRVAQLLLGHFGDRPFDRVEANRYLQHLSEKQPALATYDRKGCSDEAVRRFIRRTLLEAPTVSKTSLLRAFRRAGNRCEQKRFGDLYAEVTAQLRLAESA